MEMGASRTGHATLGPVAVTRPGCFHKTSAAAPLLLAGGLPPEELDPPVQRCVEFNLDAFIPQSFSHRPSCKVSGHHRINPNQRQWYAGRRALIDNALREVAHLRRHMIH